MKCIEMYRKEPNFLKYNSNPANQIIIKGMLAGYKTPVFGGSILNPLDNKQN